MSRPGLVVRATLVIFGVMFLPWSLFIVYRDPARYWLQSVILLALSVYALRLGLSRDEDSWLSAIDDLHSDKPDP